MNIVRKLKRSLTGLAMQPFLSLEKKERERRLEERWKRAQKANVTFSLIDENCPVPTLEPEGLKSKRIT